MANTYNKKGKIKENKDDILENVENTQDTAENAEDINCAESEGVEEDINDILEKASCARCAELQKELDEMGLRSLAEMDNFKKRLQREKEEQVKYSSENILQDIIPALDNLDLALQYANNDACKDIITGIQMTRKLLLDSLKTHGLIVISEVNVPFNPEVHEAIGQEEEPNLAANHVVRFLQNGYMLKDRLLRSAKVIVSI